MGSSCELTGPDGNTVRVSCVHISSSSQGQWQGRIQITGQLPQELQDMLGGTVTVTTGNATGKAIATGDYAEGVWTVTLEGVMK